MFKLAKILQKFKTLKRVGPFKNFKKGSDPFRKSLEGVWGKFFGNGKKKKAVLRLAAVIAVLVAAGGGGILALNGFFGGGAAIPEDTMTRGLVGYWGMDEGSGSAANDKSGNGNNGTLTNGPKWTSGKNNGALQFDGKDDYVDVLDSSSLKITSQISIEAWIKTTKTDRQGYISKWSNTVDSNNAQSWEIDVELGYINFYVNAISGADLKTTGTHFVSDGEWHHVVCITDNETKYHKIYIDGILDVSVYKSNEIIATTTDPLYIGVAHKAYKGGHWFNGQIDDVRIYNRALSAEEVRYHYNHGGPVGYWKFDEGSGASAKDSSGNNNDGAITGATWTDGKYGSALSFDGSDDYVDCRSNSSLNIADAITISAWIYPKTLGESSAGHIIGRGSTTGWVFYVYSSNNLKFLSNNAAIEVVSKENSITLNQWQYVTVTYDKQNVRFFVNGVSKGVSQETDSIANTGSCVIGARSSSGDFDFNGYIDDAKVYNYARTADEIRLDYQVGMATHLGPSGKTCSEDPAGCMDKGLVGYWDMDEGSGTVLKDKSGNTNNGTFVSSPKWTSGKNGGALQFDGKDDYVDTGINTNLRPTASITIEAWVNPSNVQNVWSDIAGGHQNRGWVIQQNSSNLNQYYFAYHNGTSWVGSGVTFNLTANIWNHLVIVKNDTGVIHYVNGKAVNSFSSIDDIVYNESFSILIGNGYSSTYRCFNGKIDDMRVYNRALSAEEVRYHYNHGGPMGYWKFDEGSGTSAKDSSGNNNDGTLTNGPTWTSGKYGSALSFDGVDDYVDCGSNSSLNITKQLTLSAWVKLAAYGSGNASTVLSKWYASTGVRQYMLTIFPDGKLYFILRKSDDSGTLTLVGNNTLQLNTWYYIVGVYNGDSQTMDVYVNGAKDNTLSGSSVPTSILSTATKVIIGAYNNGGSERFSGLIDESRIYNYARTADEIRLDYQAGMATHLGPSGKTCSEDPAGCMDKGLVGYWDMDEGGGTTLTDKSGNANSCSLVNGTIWSKGKSGTALYFDGENDYANCDAAANDISPVSGTVEAWAKADSGIGFLFHSNANTRTYIYRSSNSFSMAKGDPGVYISFPLTSTGKWHHLVLSWDNGVFWGYQDGVLIGSNSFSSSSVPSVARIGHHASAGSNNCFDGDIDEVRVYNRALSAEEVRYHYNQGAPVAHWSMDEGEGLALNDDSGNHNRGTISGATWTAGKYGSALSFDGTDDYVDCGNKQDLQITGPTTVSAWIKPNNNGYCISKRMASGYGGYWIERAVDKFQFYVDDTSSHYSVTQTENSISGTWYYVTGVFDPSLAVSERLKLYINGTYNKKASGPGAIGSSSSNFQIGRNIGNYYFNGLIDEVRVYNYARTAEQIMEDYNAGVATHLK